MVRFCVFNGKNIAEKVFTFSAVFFILWGVLFGVPEKVFLRYFILSVAGDFTGSMQMPLAFVGCGL